MPIRSNSVSHPPSFWWLLDLRCADRVAAALPHHGDRCRLFFVSARSIILLPSKEVNEGGYGYSACHQTRRANILSGSIPDMTRFN